MTTGSEVECLIVNAPKSLCKENYKLTILHSQFTLKSENQKASVADLKNHLAISYFF